jgi:hypothetical protein
VTWRTAGLVTVVLALALTTDAHADFRFLTTWGSAGTADGQFTTPVSVASNGAGTVFVVDAATNRIQRFGDEGVFLSAFGGPGPGPARFMRAGHVAADFGSVYVTDGGSARVQKFTPDGTFLLSWGSSGFEDGQFQTPSGVAIDALGNVYVVDSQTNRVQRFTSDGAFELGWGGTGIGPGQFSSAQDVAVDALGAVYVVDRLANRVQKFTADGRPLLSWGSRGTGDGQFDGPSGIATDAAGNVVVADTGNQRVEQFTPDGAFLTTFGVGGSGQGQFDTPADVAADGGANVYVADQGNARVQQFEPLPPAKAGRTANIDAVAGTVRVRPPGKATFVTLTRARQVPIGSLVHATNGTAKLTTAADLRDGQQTARFYDGLFTVTQRRTSKPVTELRLEGGNFGVCPSGSAIGSQVRAAARSKKRKKSSRKVRSLWSDGKGRFRTRGRYASAGARGTIWLVEDRCDGTFVRVRRGTVEVRDFVRGRTVIVTAPGSYLARSR